MKFQNAILSLATATLGGVNNNVVDAKLWNLRGFGNSANYNNNEVMTKEDYHSESLPSAVEELPSPSANLRELFIDEHQGERKLPKKDKKQKDKDSGKKKGGKKKGGKKGQKDELIGEAINVIAPEDVVAKAGCDDIDEDDGARFRRILKKGDQEQGGKKAKGSSKANKEDVSSGSCDSCTTTEEPTQEQIDLTGDDVAVEASDDPTCDPDAEVPCEHDEEGLEDDPTFVDPTLISPEDDGGGGAEVEATSRQLMDERRLTGNTNQIGTFAPLSCNPVEFDCTGAAGVSTVLGGESDPVVVPCGTCLVVSKILYP